MRLDAAPFLEARAVSCAREGAAICEVSLAFAPATFNVLAGPAGCGKDLLLRVLALLEPPDEGDVLVGGRATRELAADARADLRNVRFGYVFASPFLLPGLSVIENIAMPLFRIAHADATKAGRRTERLLEFADLAAVARELVDALPLAIQHRVSLARALANDPAALIVERLESAGERGDSLPLLALLRKACSEFDVAVIATNSEPLCEAAEDRVIELAAGRVRRDSQVAADYGA